MRAVHGARAVENNALGHDEARRSDVAQKPRRRVQFDFFFRRHVALDMAADHYRIGGDIGPNLGALANRELLALLLGVIVGTYSSVFVASPLLILWKGTPGKLLRRR